MGTAIDTRPVWWRVAAHPAAWSVPVMALAVLSTYGLNAETYYSFFVNGDPQGEIQLAEADFAGHVFTYTSGVLYGQLLSAVVGAALAFRHRHRVALPVAAAVSVALAAVTAVVSRPMVEPVSARTAGMGFDGSAPHRVLLTELAAYPLYAACGVGIGVLVRRQTDARRVLLLTTLALGWIVATATGLFQDNSLQAPAWLLGLPPIAAATTVALAALSGTDPLLMGGARDSTAMVAVGDWGRSAGIALLVGAVAWAVVLNAAAAWVARRPAPDRGVRERKPWL